jgi:hypothetical protein
VFAVGCDIIVNEVTSGLLLGKPSKLQKQERRTYSSAENELVEIVPLPFIVPDYEWVNVPNLHFESHIGDVD